MMNVKMKNVILFLFMTVSVALSAQTPKVESRISSMQMLIGAKGHIKAARLLVRDDAGAADNSLREAEEIMKDAQKHLKLALWNLLGE